MSEVRYHGIDRNRITVMHCLGRPHVDRHLGEKATETVYVTNDGTRDTYQWSIELYTELSPLPMGAVTAEYCDTG